MVEGVAGLLRSSTEAAYTALLVASANVRTRMRPESVPTMGLKRNISTTRSVFFTQASYLAIAANPTTTQSADCRGIRLTNSVCQSGSYGEEAVKNVSDHRGAQTVSRVLVGISRPTEWEAGLLEKIDRTDMIETRIQIVVVLGAYPRPRYGSSDPHHETIRCGDGYPNANYGMGRDENRASRSG